MGTVADRLELMAEKARKTLVAKDAARERALQLCREVIRYSTNAIRAVHRGEYEEAKELLASARLLLKDLDKTLSEHQELLDAGFVYNAQKEYAEGCITLALIAGSTFPDPDELGISYAAYLNGLGEAVGELRRHLLDCTRRGEISRCEELLATMDDIYGVLVTMDFPDAITGGLRRTTDIVRGILEKTRGDLTLSFRQRELEEKLAAFEERLGIRMTESFEKEESS
ncbi:MAG: haloacid dehalogenase [Dehalococcoidia bacterium]|nr:MAG: haloacid dehalogenase [Dehalococcoidia bacterium]